MTPPKPKPFTITLISIFLLLATNLAIASSNSQDQHSNPVNKGDSGSMIFKFDDNTSMILHIKFSLRFYQSIMGKSLSRDAFAFP